MNKRALYLILALATISALLHLAPGPLSAQSGAGRAMAPKGKPAPRTEDGKVDFSGVYSPPGRAPGDPPSKSGEGYSHNIARDLEPDDVPMQPWAKELFHKRFVEDVSKDDPEGFCLPMGTPRMAPYPWQIVQTDKLMLMLYEGNVHGYRQIFLDGRPHDPTVKETYWGDSIGHWEGDTLVIDTVGLGFGDGRNNHSWLDADGHPRTNKLHIVERLTRPELGRIADEITIDDSGAYTRPWKVVEKSALAPNWEIQETVCNENQDENGQNQDAQHLIALPHGIGLEGKEK
jgi:hypothetical protein